MFESELKELFNEEEYYKFGAFMVNTGHLWFSRENRYCLVMYIQEFIITLEDNERKQRILETCVEKYPQILGLTKENI